MKRPLNLLGVVLVSGALALTSVGASADRGNHDRGRDDRHSNRYHRDYHAGQRVHVLPSRHYYRTVVRGRPYYYYSGVFYEPQPYGYIVVNAPIGARVQTLPSGYVSFGIGGHRYFYVNTTYYLWNDRTRDYVVVEKPAGADTALAGSQEVASAAELYIYPRNGQSEEQRDKDRYECHLWAKGQTNYDPSLPNQPADMAPDYRRAMSACLEGRGYTVK
ncbi:MAG: hypothetical protein KDI19_11905 [Pseudomonadales bacterium]|nr:hypothetical protein [Pseudomonadales bacterium]